MDMCVERFKYRTSVMPESPHINNRNSDLYNFAWTLYGFGINFNYRGITGITGMTGITWYSNDITLLPYFDRRTLNKRFLVSNEFKHRASKCYCSMLWESQITNSIDRSAFKFRRLNKHGEHFYFVLYALPHAKSSKQAKQKVPFQSLYNNEAFSCRSAPKLMLSYESIYAMQSFYYRYNCCAVRCGSKNF